MAAAATVRCSRIHVSPWCLQAFRLILVIPLDSTWENPPVVYVGLRVAGATALRPPLRGILRASMLPAGAPQSAERRHRQLLHGLPAKSQDHAYGANSAPFSAGIGSRNSRLRIRLHCQLGHSTPRSYNT
ncbi:hypothetical protein NDU88_006209 [Pleurodeles waltl]|uniref:Uncharacterized protein n=1 Tax=Pleurodeles waltl TaxID=8319 RepID=A0AAV7LRB0_PLEWA|nr:hypothetical protein NDU88_006209 [Pleurodeles waltl]